MNTRTIIGVQFAISLLLSVLTAISTGNAIRVAASSGVTVGRVVLAVVFGFLSLAFAADAARYWRERKERRP